MADEYTMTKAEYLYNTLEKNVCSFSIDELGAFDDLIKGALAKFQREKMIELQKKAINAIKDYLKEGGELGYEDCAFLEIDESPEYDDDYYCIHFR